MTALNAKSHLTRVNMNLTGLHYVIDGRWRSLTLSRSRLIDSGSNSATVRNWDMFLCLQSFLQRHLCFYTARASVLVAALVSNFCRDRLCTLPQVTGLRYVMDGRWRSPVTPPQIQLIRQVLNSPTLERWKADLTSALVTYRDGFPVCRLSPIQVGSTNHLRVVIQPEDEPTMSRSQQCKSYKLLLLVNSGNC